MKDTTSLSLGRETLLSLASKLVMAVIGFGGTVVFARVLGPSGFGIYQTALAAAMIATQFSAGTGTAVKKRVSEVDVEPPEFLGAGLAVHAAFTALLVVLYVVLHPFVNRYFESSSIAVATVAVVASLGLFNVVNRTYSGLGYPSTSSWVDTLRSLLTISFQLVLVFLDFGALGLLVGFVAGTFLSALVSYVAAGVRPAVPGRETAERVYSFARWSISNELLRKGYSRSDVLLINALVGSGAVGFYATAAQLAIPGSMFGGSIKDAFAVKSSGRSSADLGVREDLENSATYAGLLSMPIFFGALAMPREIVVTVFGPAFAPAWIALVAMAFYHLMSVYRLPFEAVAEGTDNPDLVFRTNVVVFVVYVPVAVGLGLQYGLVGVIGGSIFGELARISVYQYVAHSQFGGVVLPRPILDQALSCIAMYVVVSSLVPGVIVITGWVWLAVAVSVGAAVYFAALLAVSGHFRYTTKSTLEETLDIDL